MTTNSWRHWFEAMAEVSSAPLIISDMAYRTGTTIDAGTLLELAAPPKSGR